MFLLRFCPKVLTTYISHFKSYWDQCGEVDDPIEARQQLMAKVVDRVFVYDDRVIAISLPPDFGIVLDIPEAAPNKVLEAVSERISKSASITSSDTRTQDGDDGVRTFSGYTLVGVQAEYRVAINRLLKPTTILSKRNTKESNRAAF